MDGREGRLKKVRWENRKTSVLKKGRELATLCGIRLCVVTVSPDGKVETWPENAAAVKAVLHEAVKTAAEKQRVCPRKQQQPPEIPDGMMISTDDYDVQEVVMEVKGGGGGGSMVSGNYYYNNGGIGEVPIFAEDVNSNYYHHQAHPLPPPPAADAYGGQYYQVPEYLRETNNHHQFLDHRPPNFCTGDYGGYGSGWQSQNQWTQADGFSFGAGDNDSLTGFGNFQ